MPFFSKTKRKNVVFPRKPKGKMLYILGATLRGALGASEESRLNLSPRVPVQLPTKQEH